MKTTCLTIRKCPLPLHSALKARARAHRRSLNDEALQLLASVLAVERLSESELKQRIRSIPGGSRLSLAETRQAIREGRR